MMVQIKDIASQREVNNTPLLSHNAADVSGLYTFMMKAVKDHDHEGANSICVIVLMPELN